VLGPTKFISSYWAIGDHAELRDTTNSFSNINFFDGVTTETRITTTAKNTNVPNNESFKSRTLDFGMEFAIAAMALTNCPQYVQTFAIKFWPKNVLYVRRWNVSFQRDGSYASRKLLNFKTPSRKRKESKSKSMKN